MSISEASPAPRRNPFYAIPVFGWVARDLNEGPEDTIYYLLVALLTLVVLAVMKWGIVALTMAALAMVPVVMIVLLLITVGK